MEKADEDIILAIIVSSITLVILAVFTTLFFLVFVRKKRILNRNKEELSRNFERQLLETRLEIQDQTLNNISQEIHDNFGQVLSFVKLSLNIAKTLPTPEKDEKINESTRLIAGVITDLRDLSKSLSFERIKIAGLYQIISDETDRLNRSGIIQTELQLTGQPFVLGPQTDLILYRMFQETLNNTIKHSGSKSMKIIFGYHGELFILHIRDFGNGFDTNQVKKTQGLGLSNMKQRAALIGASVAIDSQPGKGCSVSITLDRNNSILNSHEQNIHRSGR